MRRVLAALGLLLLATSVVAGPNLERRTRKTTHVVGCGGAVAVDTLFVRGARSVAIEMRAASARACSTFTPFMSISDSAWTAIPAGAATVVDSISNLALGVGTTRRGWALIYAPAGATLPFDFMRLDVRRKFGVAAVDTNLTTLDTVYVTTHVVY